MRRIAHIASHRSNLLSTLRECRRLMLALFLVILLGSTSSLCAQQRGGLRQQANVFPSCHIRPQDQIWLISTRHLPCEGNGCEATGGAPRLAYSRYEPGRGWFASSADAFFRGQNPNIVTTVYVHGNRITSDWAKDHGFTTYCRLTCGTDPRPIRHVIWSWPSDPIPCGARVVKDARVKGERTYAQSYYLGWWLCRFSPQQRVSLVGFSYGGRTILGALHLVAGGESWGCCLGGNGNGRVRPRMAIMACASEANWVCPGGRNDRALLQLDRGLVIFNPNDPALQRYQRFMPGASSPALGAVGVPSCANGGRRLRQINVSRTIGNVHRFKPYMDSGAIATEIRNIALWPNTGRLAQQPATLSTDNQLAQVPVGDLPTFDLAAQFRLDDWFVDVVPGSTDLVSESPVSELPTFDLAETLNAAQPEFQQAAEPTAPANQRR